MADQALMASMGQTQSDGAAISHERQRYAELERKMNDTKTKMDVEAKFLGSRLQEATERLCEAERERDSLQLRLAVIGEELAATRKQQQSKVGIVAAGFGLFVAAVGALVLISRKTN